jgi:pilus assembly protein Flp/PilA
MPTARAVCRRCCGQPGFEFAINYCRLDEISLSIIQIRPVLQTSFVKLALILILRVVGFDKSRTKRIRKSTTLSVRIFVRVRIIKLEDLLMNKLVVRFAKDESGATAIEYGLIAAGISVAIIAVVQGLGTNLKNTFQSVSTALK